MRSFSVLKRYPFNYSGGGFPVGKVIHLLTELVKILLIVMMGVLVIVVFAQVLFRYVLLAPLPWSGELANLLLLYITFLGSAVLVKEKGHMAVDYFILKIPIRLQKAFQLFIKIAMLFVSGVLFYFGSHFTFLSANGVFPALQISIAWSYAILPVMGVISMIFLIAFIIDDLKQWRNEEA
jgi:TRAP-type C4-dicarboxylate transport system permease small subunit